jgi:hypothetical protein
MASSDLVLISKAELDELRKLKEDLPAIIEKTRNERDTERMKALTQRHRENPEQHREQSKKRYDLKKDEINAKRREAYKLKKAAAGSPGPSSDRSDDSPGCQ